MTEKTKKTLVIAAGSVACIALAVGIGMRFGGNAKAPQGEIPDSSGSGSSSIIVDIDETDPTHTPEIDINKPDNTPDPGAGADSTGTEQSIQSDPVKPEQPEPPESPASTQKEQEHTGEDVPESDRNTPEPPKYEQPPKPETPTKPENNEPAPGSTNNAGQVYVPGFGYVENSGANQGGSLDDMYENGNKIGEMG